MREASKRSYSPKPNQIRLRAKGQLTLPAAIRYQAEIEEGDLLEFIVRGPGEVLLRLSTASFETEIELPSEMAARIDRSLAELDAGLGTRYVNEHDFLESLRD